MAKGLGLCHDQREHVNKEVLVLGSALCPTLTNKGSAFSQTVLVDHSSSDPLGWKRRCGCELRHRSEPGKPNQAEHHGVYEATKAGRKALWERCARTLWVLTVGGQT